MTARWWLCGRATTRIIAPSWEIARPSWKIRSPSSTICDSWAEVDEVSLKKINESERSWENWVRLKRVICYRRNWVNRIIKPRWSLSLLQPTLLLAISILTTCLLFSRGNDEAINLLSRQFSCCFSFFFTTSTLLVKKKWREDFYSTGEEKKGKFYFLKEGKIYFSGMKKKRRRIFPTFHGLLLVDAKWGLRLKWVVSRQWISFWGWSDFFSSGKLGREWDEVFRWIKSLHFSNLSILFSGIYLWWFCNILGFQRLVIIF